LVKPICTGTRKFFAEDGILPYLTPLAKGNCNFSHITG